MPKVHEDAEIYLTYRGVSVYFTYEEGGDCNYISAEILTVNPEDDDNENPWPKDSESYAAGDANQFQVWDLPRPPKDWVQDKEHLSVIYEYAPDSDVWKICYAIEQDWLTPDGVNLPQEAEVSNG